MSLDIAPWLANTFGDGERTEPLRRYRMTVSVLIADIETDQPGTAEQADEYARQEVGRLLGGLDDYEIESIYKELIEEGDDD